MVQKGGDGNSALSTIATQGRQSASAALEAWLGRFGPELTPGALKDKNIPNTPLSRGTGRAAGFRNLSQEQVASAYTPVAAPEVESPELAHGEYRLQSDDDIAFTQRLPLNMLLSVEQSMVL